VKSGELSVGMDRESDVKSRYLQDCISHPYRLRINELAVIPLVTKTLILLIKTLIRD
jgi:hypothetical protein